MNAGRAAPQKNKMGVRPMKKGEALFALLTCALLSMMALSYLLYVKGNGVIIFRSIQEGILQESKQDQLFFDLDSQDQHLFDPSSSRDQHLFHPSSSQDQHLFDSSSSLDQRLFHPSSSQDRHLFHPSSSLEDLWVTINKNILVRRLGFHDTRNSSYPSVVFNCMYDDRPELPHLRKLYSLLTFRNGLTACHPLEYWAAIGDYPVRERYKEIYYNYILRTRESITEAPVYGQISIHSNCNFPSRVIPIKDNTTDRNYTYGVCLHKSLYNLTKPEMLVHWVELNLALGVEFMTIYLQNGYIPESYYTLMIPYIKRGIVEVLDWGLRPPVIPGYTKFWGQTAVINECIYRNMYKVKYLGLYDIDEFIIPQKLKTVPELIETFEKENPNAHKAVGYIARNAFFYRRSENLPELKRLPRSDICHRMRLSFLPRYYTFTVRNKVTHLQHDYHKIIVKPIAAIGVWTHWVKKYMDGYTKEFYFSTEDALIHHYRVPDKYPLTNFNEKVFIMSRYFNETFKGITENLCQ